MADDVPAKKLRLSREENEERAPIQQEEDIRNLRIDISQYSASIQKMTNEELVQVFNIGVAVKESFTLTILENSSFVKEELKEQMKPIHVVMDKLPNEVERNINKIDNSVADNLLKSKTEISGQVNDLRKELVNEVSEVSKKVLPVGEMEKRIIQEIKSTKSDIDKAINGLAKEFQKPATKGVIGENTVLSILEKNFPNYTITDVSQKGGMGDLHVSTPYGHQFLIEVKNHQKPIPMDGIDKFKRNVLSGDVKVGIMLSIKSGIATKSKKGNFEVNHREGKFLIYVPNALAQQEVMIWSVSLATELAELDVELKDNQAEKLQKLCESFQEKVKDAEKCRERIETLKNVTKGLEESIKPIFDMIKDAEKKLKMILKPDSSKTTPHASASTPTFGSQPQN